jgi:hypothetical protein
MHPVFTYWGRNLSGAGVPVPVMRAPGGPPGLHVAAGPVVGRPLFVRVERGDMSDQGFGPGVRVAPEFSAEAGRAEEEVMVGLVGWDGAREGSGGR